jgi:SAM-dependent methyltransferase
MFDAVIAGTAWHWVDPEAGAAKAAQVLRPGGLIAPFNNVGQVPAGLTEALAWAYQKIAPDSPVNLQSHNRAMDVYQPLFAKIGDGIRDVPAGEAGRGAEGRGRRDRGNRGQLHDALHHRGDRCNTNQCSMTGSRMRKSPYPSAALTEQPE